MYCSNCGKYNSEDSKFCQYCGSKLAKTSIKDKLVANVGSDTVEGYEEKHYQDRNQKKTNILSNYLNVIKKYVDFKGRASRREYWLFFLANLIISFGLGFIEGLLGVNSKSEESIFVSVYQLFILLPSLAVGVRRMHDANEGGWASIIPIFNLIVASRKGNSETNKYGPPPKD